MPVPVHIYGAPISTWTRTARMACVEKGVEYELVLRRPGSAGHPFGRIPVLEDDGVEIVESLAIVTYIDEANPGPSLQPESLAERTLMRTWMSVCADYVYRQVVRGIPRDRPITDEERGTARVALEGVNELIGETEFLTGNAVSL